MEDLNTTLDAIDVHQWHIVLLGVKSKRPQGQSWTVLTNTAAIHHHVTVYGGNIGLVCGPDSGVAALDFDQPGVLAAMSLELGPLLPWVQTRKGFHCYVRWEADLPARMMWRGEKVGEIQRGPSLQHVVMPPSINPDSGLPYLWLVNPSQPVLELPDEWRNYLKSEYVPDYIATGDCAGQPSEEVWDGPTPEEILFRAGQQPGAKRRRSGIKFQCPGCRKDGHDKSRDNAIVYLDGRWGCAVDPEHKRDIGELLGWSESDRKLADKIVPDDTVQSIMKRLNGLRS